MAKKSKQTPERSMIKLLKKIIHLTKKDELSWTEYRAGNLGSESTYITDMNFSNGSKLRLEVSEGRRQGSNNADLRITSESITIFDNSEIPDWQRRTYQSLVNDLCIKAATAKERQDGQREIDKEKEEANKHAEAADKAAKEILKNCWNEDV